MSLDDAERDLNHRRLLALSKTQQAHAIKILEAAAGKGVLPGESVLDPDFSSAFGFLRESNCVTYDGKWLRITAAGIDLLLECLKSDVEDSLEKLEETEKASLKAKETATLRLSVASDRFGANGIDVAYVCDGCGKRVEIDRLSQLINVIGDGLLPEGWIHYFVYSSYDEKIIIARLLACAKPCAVEVMKKYKAEEQKSVEELAKGLDEKIAKMEGEIAAAAEKEPKP